MVLEDMELMDRSLPPMPASGRIRGRWPNALEARHRQLKSMGPQTVVAEQTTNSSRSKCCSDLGRSDRTRGAVAQVVCGRWCYEMR